MHFYILFTFIFDAILPIDLVRKRPLTMEEGFLLVWPQWWSFADMSQQGLHFSKIISKKEYFLIWLSQMFIYIGGQKVPKSDFQSHFCTSKIIRIFLNFFLLKNICLEEGFLLFLFFDNFNFWTTLFSKMVPNFWRSMWTSVKVKSFFFFFGFFC